jgi:dTDP-4-amino-4,6-dideoxygalactose transaminase
LLSLLDLKPQFDSIRDEIRVAIDRVIESQRFILGPEVEGLEREISQYSQCAFGIGVSSGTDALLVALMAIDLKPGDEVITTPYSFFATAGCIARLGATPVFVDIEPNSFNIDPRKIEARITKRTRAILPVHLFGQMADMDAIVEISRRHDLIVVEDAAQAIGAEIRGRRAGAFGLLTCFSFYPTKNLGAFGDAGMVTTNDAAMAERVRRLRNHGFSSRYYNEVLGGNFRLDEIQAAVLRVKFKYLEQWTEGRRRNARQYAELLSGQDGVQLPSERSGYRHIFNQFVIQTNRRDALMGRFKEKGIGSEIYYPLPLHLQKCFRYLGNSDGVFPVSESASRETLALPIYPELRPSDIQFVADTILGLLAA